MRRWRKGRHGHPGLRARAGHGEHPRGRGHPAARRPDAVKIFVGGLPQHPEPPLNYQIVYSLEGVLDYYTTPSWVLRDGKPTQVEALSEREPVDFPQPVGELEAFHTGGGISTMAFAYEGQDRRDGVQDAPLSRTRRHHAADPRARACSTSSRSR